jgi:hypothetical protein
MAARERFIYQPYLRGRRGAVSPGPAVSCRNEAEALRRAERAMAGAQVIGAHVVRVLADEDAGDFGEPEFLLAVGIVPESV